MGSQSVNTSYIGTLLLRPIPRPSLEVFTQSATPQPLPTEDHAYLSTQILTSFTALIESHSLTILPRSIFHLDHVEHTKRLECELIDITGGSNIQRLKSSRALREIEYCYNIDIALQPNTVWRKHKRLVVFDMDSTLIQQEVIDEIAAFVGVKPQVAEITERAMRGELDFSASLRSRCALLKNVPATVFDTLKSNGTISFTPGALTLCTALKRLGYTLAVLSGGFQPLAEWVKETLSLDYAYANTLGVSEDGKTLSGEVLGDIVNAERKAALLVEIARKEGIDLRQVVAVGDGANDLVMMKAAGFGVAFNAKPKVQIEAPSHINTTTLQDILYLFGLTAAEQDQLLNPEKYLAKL